MRSHGRGGQAGLTVLELIVGATLVMVVVGVSLPSVSRFWQAYQLDSATQTLFANLETGRYTAISRNVNVVVEFDQAARTYRLFEDTNGDGNWNSGERVIGPHSLPRAVAFSGNGLSGPPSASSPGPVSDPITFSGDRFSFTPQGTCNKMGTVYLQTSASHATALSSFIPSVGRIKVYRWSAATSTWK